jgi:predicted DNA-binding transcriptional regulator YafY
MFTEVAMYSPTTRLLTVLELLQAKASVSGPELAQTLEVDVRSVRRYITMLRDMGIPVESETGRFGSYSLRPGFRLPPLMFTNSEILAVMLGLAAVRHLGLARALAVESAAAKIYRVLPDIVREQAQALQEVLTLNLPASLDTSDEIIALVSLATYQRQQVWLAYQGQTGEQSERVFDSYGIVYQNGCWYCAGYCHLRHDIRIFRLDRVRQVRLLESRFTSPQAFDTLDYLLTQIATLPEGWQVEVLLGISLERAQALVLRVIGQLEAVEGGVLLRMRAVSLAWAARYLISLDCPLTVLHPPELREELRQVAKAILAIADEHVGLD